MRPPSAHPWRVGGLAASLIAALALALAGCGGGRKGDAPAPVSRSGPPLHVALGDSLAVGVQPGADGVRRETAEGYPARIVAARRRATPDLQLAQLGCGGMTTRTLIAGAPACAPARTTPYGTGSPLAYAEALLRTGRVRSLSIDVGANDLNVCLGDPFHPDQACLARQIADAGRNAATIAKRLRAAGGPGVAMVFLPVHDPYLGTAWIAGDEAYARDSVTIVSRLNDAERVAFAREGFAVADVDVAFLTRAPLDGPTVPRGARRVPRAVDRVCALSWACSPPPRGPDVHLNDAGARAFAAAALAALDR